VSYNELKEFSGGKQRTFLVRVCLSLVLSLSAETQQSRGIIMLVGGNMTRYLRIGSGGVELLRDEARYRDMVFTTPTAVLRAVMLSEAEPRPREMQVRVEDKVWKLIEDEAERSGLKTKRLNADDTYKLLRHMINKYGKSPITAPSQPGREPPRPRPSGGRRPATRRR
jgi:hypothetical protein